MNFKCYLAGQIRGLTYEEGQDWRDYVKNQLKDYGIDGYSPLRTKQFLSGFGKLEGSYEHEPLSSSKGLFTRDMNDVRTSDAIIANVMNMTSASIGTSMEIMAGHIYKIPIVLVMEEGNIHYHPFITESVGYIVDNLDDGLDIIKTILLP